MEKWNTDEQEAKLFSVNVLYFLDISLKSNENRNPIFSLMGIPLHLTMLPDTLNTKARAIKFLEVSSSEISISILYEHFIESKYQIFLADKCKAVTGIAENAVNQIYEAFWNNHKLAAVKYLLSDRELEQFKLVYGTFGNKLEPFVIIKSGNTKIRMV